VISGADEVIAVVIVQVVERPWNDGDCWHVNASAQYWHKRHDSPE
jgi:hypothetical protein